MAEINSNEEIINDSEELDVNENNETDAEENTYSENENKQNKIAEFIGRIKNIRNIFKKKSDDTNNFFYDDVIISEETEKNKFINEMDFITQKSDNQKEYEDLSDKEEILEDIIQLKSSLKVRMYVLIFTSLFSLIITMLNDFSHPLISLWDKQKNPVLFILINIILGLVSVSFSYTVIIEGIKNIIHKRADCDSIASLGVVISVVVGIATLSVPSVAECSFYHLYISSAILGLLFNTFGKILIVIRTEKNFKYVSKDIEHYGMVSINNEDIATKMTKGVLNDFPELVLMKKTSFIKDFMRNSYSSDISDTYSKKTLPLILISSLFIGILSMFFEKNAAGAVEKIFSLLSVISGTVAISSSLSLMHIVNLPFALSQNKYLRSSSAMLGYSAIDHFSDANSVLVDAKQLFPKESVTIKTLKLLGSTRIDECILMAASLSCKAESILTPTFERIIRGKTKLLYPVESYVYEDSKGLSGWIKNKRVLLGSRELMESHSIEGLPTLSKEAEYANGNLVLYLSVSGIISMIFIINVEPSITIKKSLKKLSNNGIVTIVHAVDGFINKEFLSEIFDIDTKLVKILSFKSHDDYKNETKYVKKVSSSMICSGRFQSMVSLLIGTKHLKSVSNLGIAVQAGALFLGLGISLVMILLGSFSRFTSTFVVIYNLLFFIITIFIQNKKL